MQRRLVAQQDPYMTSCTRTPELLPLSSSTWRILHERHYTSPECGPLGSSSTQLDEGQQQIHNWPPKLSHCKGHLRQPRVACYSKAKVSCWRTARHTTNCGGTTVRNSRLFPHHRM